MAYRRQRVEEQLRDHISEIVLREVKDPRLGFVTITEVRMSPDLRHAKVFVSVMGDDEEREASLGVLNGAEGFLKSRIGKRLRLRYLPELVFVEDDTLDRSARIEELLRQEGLGGGGEAAGSGEGSSPGGAPGQPPRPPASQDLEGVVTSLAEHDRFVLAGHRDPDGDSLGSAMALALGLEKLGKSCRVLSADPVPRAYRDLPGMDRVEVARRLPDGWPVVVLVECNGTERSGMEGFEGRTVVNIDHHAANPSFGDVNWVDAGVAAVAVMVHRLLGHLGVALDREIASLLYVAVLTDTGSFRYSNSDPTAFRVAAELVEHGADPAAIATAVYENVTVGRVRLLAAALSTLTLEEEGRVAWMVLSRDAFDRAGGDADTEGIVNHARAVEGVEVAVLFKEAEDGGVRVSLRSTGTVDSAALAGQFGGGGHPRAAGCTVEGELGTARARVLEAVRRALGGAHGGRA